MKQVLTSLALILASNVFALNIQIEQGIPARDPSDSGDTFLWATFGIVETQKIDQTITHYARLKSISETSSYATIKKPSILKLSQTLTDDSGSFTLDLELKDSGIPSGKHVFHFSYTPPETLEQRWGQPCQILSDTYFMCRTTVNGVHTEFTFDPSDLNIYQPRRNFFAYLIKPSFFNPNNSSCLKIEFSEKGEIKSTSALPLNVCEFLQLPQDGSQFRVELKHTVSPNRILCYDAFSSLGYNFEITDYMNFKDTFEVASVKADFFKNLSLSKVKTEGCFEF